jgi:hypothetical protein
MANSPCITNDISNIEQNIQTVNFCKSFLFRTSIGSNSCSRAMPNNGVGYVQQKIVNPYTNTTTNKIGSTSGNDTSISKAMRYSQYVNNPNNRGNKNTQTYSYSEYVKKYGPLPEIDRSCYSTPPFNPQVLRSNNTKKPTGLEFAFQRK